MRHHLAFPIFVACATACPGDPATTDETEGSSLDASSSTAGADSTGSTAEPTTTSGEGSTTTIGETTAGESSTGAPVDLCGDGVLDEGERCDDGNDAAADGCEACQPVAHVDWTVQVAGEAGGFDTASDVAFAPDGTIVVVGAEGGAGSQPLIIAFGPGGEVLWKYLHPTEYDSGAYESIEIGADGSLYAAGRMAIDPGVNSAAVLHKFTPERELVWAFEELASEPYNAYANGVALAGDAAYTVGTELGSPTRMIVRRHALGTGAAEWAWTGPDPAAATKGRGIAVAGEHVIAVGAWQLPDDEYYPVAVALSHQGDKVTHVTLNYRGEFTDVEAIEGGVVISGWRVVLDAAPLLWRTDAGLDDAWFHTPELTRSYLGVAADPLRGVVAAGIDGIADYDGDAFVGLHDGAGEIYWSGDATGPKPSGSDRTEDVAFGPRSFAVVDRLSGPDGSYDLWIRHVLFG